MIPDVQTSYEKDELFILPFLRCGICRCECCNEPGAFAITIGWLSWAVSFIWPFADDGTHA